MEELELCIISSIYKAIIISLHFYIFYHQISYILFFCCHYRIYVDLPDAENRMKILKIFLSQENLDPSFKFEELANATDGYSGSDLKVTELFNLSVLWQDYSLLFFSCYLQNLCIAASYRPVQEFLEEEKQVTYLSYNIY